MTEGVFKRFGLERKHQSGQASIAEQLLLARLWITDGRPIKAIDLLATVRTSDLEMARSIAILKGLALERISDIAGAKSSYLAVLKDDPDNSVANLRLGVFEFLTGDLDKALVLLERSRQGNAVSSEALYYLWILRRELGPIEEAERLLSLLVESDSRGGYWSGEAYDILMN